LNQNFHSRIRERDRRRNPRIGGSSSQSRSLGVRNTLRTDQCQERILVEVVDIGRNHRKWGGEGYGAAMPRGYWRCGDAVARRHPKPVKNHPRRAQNDP
jgi:hypothetical protein